MNVNGKNPKLVKAVYLAIIGGGNSGGGLCQIYDDSVSNGGRGEKPIFRGEEG